MKALKIVNCKEKLSLQRVRQGLLKFLNSRSRNTGNGLTSYQNPKAKLNHVPLNEKAYDASRMIVFKVNFDANENVYETAPKIVGVRVQNVVDPEIAALLDDDDLLRFGSDAFFYVVRDL
ncbi:protein LTV1-like protein [Cucumis melo var. makuwa]|uniref:Protein LTV1-like protein n=1 Tax=Cucumis melo var. makuwa TaxID=1194695 RepID=A0A5D3DJU8_CUCMM|nr:protein LTV1-like protein [Cucumis melo var. makuwa]